MAQQLQIILVSDLDGGPADETVQFGFDGITYEIDLSADQAAALRHAYAPYIKAGRKATGPASRRGRASASAGTRRGGNRKIREWAKTNGFQVSGRGPISAEIVDAYQQAVA